MDEAISASELAEKGQCFGCYIMAKKCLGQCSVCYHPEVLHKLSVALRMRMKMSKWMRTWNILQVIMV